MSLPDFEYLLRELTPQVLGTVVRRHRDFAAAEDAVQDALLAAATQWPRDGVPENPRAWLTQVALRRMTDEIRSSVARRRREADTASELKYAIPFIDFSSVPEEDDTLQLIYLCCHPDLTTPSAIALTLRAIGGLTTAEIARAFLVPEATMAQRISRAKQTIKDSNTPFERNRDGSLRAVLHVLYLIFNEGYTASAGDELQRSDLANEAIRLTRLVRAQLPDHTEVSGLLALMLLTDARRMARAGPAGEVIPLDKQDRSLWNRDQIAEGVAILSKALPKGSIGPYQLQAAVAAVHDESPSASETDWPQILALYELLRRMTDNPMVALNHAVAAAMVQGPARGLELLDKLASDARVAGNHRMDAVRAHLLELAGDCEAAAIHYRAAASKTSNLPERNYLLGQAARLDSISAASLD